VRPQHRPASALVDHFCDHLQQHVAAFPQRIAERLA
jgi:hypothetical protein